MPHLGARLDNTKGLTSSRGTLGPDLPDFDSPTAAYGQKIDK